MRQMTNNSALVQSITIFICCLMEPGDYHKLVVILVEVCGTLSTFFVRKMTSNHTLV